MAAFLQGYRLRALPLRLRHWRRRATIADRHPGCGLPCHRARPERSLPQFFALQPYVPLPEPDAAAHRTLPEFSARLLSLRNKRRRRYRWWSFAQRTVQEPLTFPESSRLPVRVAIRSLLQLPTPDAPAPRRGTWV